MPIFNHGLPIKANVIQGEGGTDTSQDTVTPETLLEGVTAHNAAGEPIVGTCDYNANTESDTVTADKLSLGETAHDASGAQITGTLDTEAIRAEGVAEGKQAEYDAFWDGAQYYGARENYEYFLGGLIGDAELLRKPKYKINATDNSSYFCIRFMSPENRNSYELFDMSEWDMDFSKTSSARYFLNDAAVKNVYADLSNANSIFYAFGTPNLGRGENITVKVSEKCTDFNYAFSFQTNLTSLMFADGSVVASNGLNVSHSPLNKASLTSIVNALSDTTTGLTVTVRASAVKKAFETSEGANDGTSSDEWLQLIATKPNWTINAIDS